jgi:hypothetical protein
MVALNPDNSCSVLGELTADLRSNRGPGKINDFQALEYLLCHLLLLRLNAFLNIK